jgi:quinol monooxygenase YgiN
VFEIDTDAEAYRAHLETLQFKSFRATTETMVKSASCSMRFLLR